MSYMVRPVSVAAMVGCQNRREAHHRIDKATTVPISLIGLILLSSYQNHFFALRN